MMIQHGFQTSRGVIRLSYNEPIQPRIQVKLERYCICGCKCGRPSRPAALQKVPKSAVRMCTAARMWDGGILSFPHLLVEPTSQQDLNARSIYVFYYNHRWAPMHTFISHGCRRLHVLPATVKLALRCHSRRVLFVKTVGLLHLCSRYLVLKKNEAVSNMMSASMPTWQLARGSGSRHAGRVFIHAWLLANDYNGSPVPSIDDHRPRRSCTRKPPYLYGQYRNPGSNDNFVWLSIG
jgi:hypothetical protein